MSTAEPARKRQLSADDDVLTTHDCSQVSDADQLLNQQTSKRQNFVSSDYKKGATNNGNIVYEGHVFEHIDQHEDFLQVKIE